MLDAPGLFSPLGQVRTPQGTVRATVILQGCVGNLLALPITVALCGIFPCLGPISVSDSLGREEVSP